MSFLQYHILHLLTLTLFFTLSFSTHSPPSDASLLLSFKLKADPHNKLNFTSSTFCKWQGIQCTHLKVHRLILQNLNLSGSFPPNTLTRLDQLRVLSLQTNSLTGPIPDLSTLINLKSLFLNHNSFSGSFPPSLISLHRLKTLDLSHNNLTGSIPLSLTSLDRLYYLRLDLNHFNGSIPPLNQTSLKIFNISHNNLTGPIPVTPTLLRFTRSSFLFNSRLCGEIVHRECKPAEPFFGSAAPKPINQIIQQQPKHVNKNKTNKLAAIIGFCGGVFVLCFVICVITRVVKRNRYRKKIMKPTMASDYIAAESAAAVMKMEEDRALEEKVRKLQMAKSGSLVFCAGEAQDYTMEQLMKASAELLGKGTIGTTYKAVLDNRLIVCVKRLDGFKMTGISKEEFDRQMTAVGGLRHPKLVALRGFIQAKEERLLVYDYQPNGSLFSLIHGSKSARARPLHWTSCLKIAEDVAQGLNYIHQAWSLVDPALLFEEPDSVAYKAPETHKLDHQPTSKSDIYSFGVLLVELLTGKPPSQHPYLLPDELVHWVRSMRDDDGSEDNRLVMLLEVAIACSATSPEQRPTMWQVLKMIQEIKQTVVAEDGDNAFPTLDS
ncbi:putative inactive receptor kinase [Heracleum sosnowskyi]|uniref:Inactive receptor kinase n=1 Tax=Heracleum sosnowskyi TaxID=360622 RepID=A0AAD8MYG7_9APIA|nr:putative inactive receptor kinase [Heracleum sosnowskyi]